MEVDILIDMIKRKVVILEQLYFDFPNNEALKVKIITLKELLLEIEQRRINK